MVAPMDKENPPYLPKTTVKQASKYFGLYKA